MIVSTRKHSGGTLKLVFLFKIVVVVGERPHNLRVRLDFVVVQPQHVRGLEILCGSIARFVVLEGLGGYT